MSVSFTRKYKKNLPLIGPDNTVKKEKKITKIKSIFLKIRKQCLPTEQENLAFQYFLKQIKISNLTGTTNNINIFLRISSSF